MTIQSLPAKRSTFVVLRLTLSAAPLALLLGLVFFAWFPGIYFDLAGVGELLLVLTVVVLLIGPGLSTLVFKPGKQGLKMDLVIIFIVELLALAYFGSLLIERRPQNLVFAIDRFQVIATGQIAEFPYRFEELADRPFFEPRLVSAQFPDDPEERSALKLGVVLEGKPDIDVRPDHWYPYDEAIPLVLKAARPLAELRRRGKNYADVVDRWLQGQPGESGDYVFMPLVGTVRDATAVLGTDDGVPIDILDLDPWE